MIDENPIKTIVEELKDLANVKNFVGDPIETNEKILIPFMKWGVGFGAGAGNSSDGNDGFGSGAAAGIEPISIVVVDKKVEGMDGVRVLNLTKGTETSKAISELGIVATDLIKEILDNCEQDKSGLNHSKTSQNEKTDGSADKK
jgi:uncharacterized spore protein YtfJ